MKKNFFKILDIVLAICVVLLLFKNNSLENQINNMVNENRGSLNMVNQRLNDIMWQVDNRLEEYTNFISFYDCTYGKNDLEAGSAEVIVSVMPKEYNPEITKVFAVYNGAEYPLEYTETGYKGIVPVKLFESGYIGCVKLYDGDNVRTEKLDIYLNPYNEFYSSIIANCSGGYSGTFSSKKNAYIISNFDGHISIDVEIAEDDEAILENMEYVEYLDGKEIKREKIDIGFSGHTSYDIDNKKNFEIPYGSTLEICVESTDKAGILHKCVVKGWKVTASGAEDITRWDRNIELLYKDGKLLNANDKIV